MDIKVKFNELSVSEPLLTICTLAPAGKTSVVFRNSAFADDVVKTNLAAILQQHGLENVRSL